MCCGKETYEEVKEGRVGLTRRQVLRAMGVGTGLMALGGLTGCIDGAYKDPISTGGQLAAQAKGKDLGLDAQFLKLVMKSQKALLKRLIHLKREEILHPPVDLQAQIDTVRGLSLKMVDHYERVGLTAEFDRKAGAIINSLSSPVLPPAPFHDAALRDLEELGEINNPYIQILREVLLGGVEFTDQDRQEILAKIDRLGLAAILKGRIGSLRLHPVSGQQDDVVYCTVDVLVCSTVCGWLGAQAGAACLVAFAEPTPIGEIVCLGAIAYGLFTCRAVCTYVKYRIPCDLAP